jgi:hypothetical protein
MWIPFANALDQLCESEKTLVIMSYELRSKQDAAFFPYIRNKFSVTKIPNEELDPVFQSDDIGVFFLQKLPKDQQKPFPKQ